MDRRPLEHSTRSGRTFSPYEPIVCNVEFDVLLQSSTAEQSILLDSFDQEQPTTCPSTPIEANSLPTVTPLPVQIASSSTSVSTSDTKRDGQPISGSHARRKRRRKEEKSINGQYARAEVKERIVKNAVSISTTFEFADAPAASGAYCAKRSDLEGRKVKYTVEQLSARGFQVIGWDGRTDRPIVDKNGRIIGVLVGRSDDPEYDRAAERAFSTILEEGRKGTFRPDEVQHHRSATPAMNIGVMHGKGTLKPVNLNNHQNTEMA
ncbi:hypothetical protein BDZ97DRAFT_1921353 [Flammula alnicola]|nr:hypothetical protein BDZ97DRAFT_1921353 [Flammula alnicola]